ncbi:solute carrier family 35 member SLC35F1/F2/F6 [Sporodiniella umbellata]|nr:solute carrier family 35 member SLC35F1/F2/F6 [Sporodiniella umbellata]
MQIDSRVFLPIFLGQVLSLCITGTSSASSALWKHYGISIPFTQNFFNYLILTIFYYGSSILFFKHKPFSKLTWQVLGFSFADVGGNVLAVLAFKRTSVLSALILSSWTIPCIMLLSTYFLHAKYTLIHIKSAALCFFGLVIIIWCDVKGDSESSGPIIAGQET